MVNLYHALAAVSATVQQLMPILPKARNIETRIQVRWNRNGLTTRRRREIFSLFLSETPRQRHGAGKVT